MDIIKLIKAGESETVEFKAGFNKEAIETAVAFSNTRGGVIIIGVDNQGNIKGVDISNETLKDWANRISQNTEPTVIPDIKSDKIKGKRIAIIEVPEFPLKPVATKGRCFRRMQSSNRQMSPQEIAQMHLLTAGSSWDALPARNASLNDIDLEKVDEFIELSSATGRRNFKKGVNPAEILEKLELVKEGIPTWAAILLFGKRPQSLLIQAQVHCGRFRTNIEIIDDKLFGGTIIEQIDETLEFLQKHMKVRFIITGKSRREEIWDYPLDALREAVVNSICHRDYNDTPDIQIKIFDNSIQIWNPGPLPFGITLEDLYRPEHSSRPRNKLIAQVFYDLSIIERYGSGIQRMIIACEKAGIPKPEFQEVSGGFMVTLRKDTFEEGYFDKFGLNDRQLKACLYITENGRITNREYREINGIKQRLASNELKNMMEKEVLERLGTTGRGTYYVLRKKHEPK